MDNTMRFELTSQQVKFRDILRKEFLELEIYAISDINPNRNMTHFTLESMEKALPNMKNKPIVASFNNGDFGSHDGRPDYDDELEKGFWNVENGERILGWIRESDPVEIVKKDGLNWIKFRCVLCVTYCYNQVKKLLKDKSKKVSVEITVHDAEIVNGIEEIYDFTLNGVTILGSKNGKQVIEAIPDAHVSILEKLDGEAFEEQKRVLTFAYQKIEGADDSQKSNKEVSAKVEDQLLMEEQNSTASEEHICNQAETPEEECTCTATSTEEKAEEEKHEEKFAEQNVANAVQEETSEEEKCAAEDKPEESNFSSDDSDDDNKSEEACKCEYEAQICSLNAENTSLKEACNQYTAQIEELTRENNELKEHYADYDEIKNRMEAAEAKVHEHFCAELKKAACSMMAGEKISDSDRQTIESKCLEGKYTCEDEIKRDVAYAIYQARPVKEEKYSTSLMQTVNVENNVKTNAMSREERIAERNRRSNN